MSNSSFDPNEGINNIRNNLKKAMDAVEAGVRSVTNASYPAVDV
ncbi:MAG: hypothetical protein AAF125_22510 [Chloroflexota bacterium]